MNASRTRRLSKDQITKAYRDLVSANGGRLVGGDIFERDAGVPKHYWTGVYWPRWSAFQRELGFEPNAPMPRIPDEVVFESFAKLTLKLKAVPTEGDIVLARRSDPTFPSKGAFRRWGSREELLAKVLAHCAGRPELNEVVELLGQGASASQDLRLRSLKINGFVYLLRSGKHYKIGHTNASGRRIRELSIQLPKKPDTVHVIETDDPKGIEDYWHRRFEDQREGGEWFTLSPDDVAAFRRRKFM